MPDDFAALGAIARDVCFDVLGASATLLPTQGPARPVTLLRRTGDPLLAGLGGGQLVYDGLLAEIRAAELPAAGPAPEDVIAVDGRRYRVRSARWADAARAVWLIDAVPE
jgi:hypothetical protein